MWQTACQATSALPSRITGTDVIKHVNRATRGRTETQLQRRCQELQQRVAEQSSMIETLLARVIDAQEGERRRIAMTGTQSVSGEARMRPAESTTVAIGIAWSPG